MHVSHWLAKFYCRLVKRGCGQRIKSRQRATSAAERIESLEDRVLLATWTGDIPNGTVWPAGQIQRIDSDVHIPSGSTLTIQPGAIVKFNSYSYDFIVDGTMLAQGTSGSPIIFTEIRDDVGGDTNGDGNGTSPFGGNWGRIEFKSGSTGSVLDHVEVRYGGFNSSGEVVVSGGQLTLTNSTVRNSSVAGVRIETSNPVLTGNTYQNNPGGALSMDLASNPAISGVTVSGNAVNGLVLDAGTLAVNGTWNDPDIAYWMSGDITVPQGKSLTIAAGQVIKRPYFSDLIVSGSLSAVGTSGSPIIFTELRDDVKSDTNNDGTGSSPFNGNSGVILFTNTSTANVMDHVEVRYGGYNNLAAVTVDGAPLSFTNGVIRNSSTAGMRIQSSNPTVTGNTFSANSQGAVSMDLGSKPAISGNTLSGNGVNGVTLDSGLLTTNGVWNDPDIVYWMTGDVTVPVGMSLTIAAGQVIKRPYFGDLFVNGSLTANGSPADPVIFTELEDDVKGDTNNDASGSSPYNGNAGVILFSNTSTGNVLDRVEVRYGGYNNVAAVVDVGAPLSFTNGVIRNSGTGGLRIENSNPVITGNAFTGNSQGAITMDLGSNPALSGNTLTNNAVNGVVLDTGSLTTNLVWNDPDIAYWFSNDITVPAGKTLTIAAGQVIKRPFFGDLIVNGSLIANGTLNAPVIFTETRDDILGDTNNDGTNSTPYAGNSGVVAFTATSTANVLDHVEFRYGGYNNLASVLVDGGAPLTLTNSVVRNSNVAGIRIQDSNPILTSNTYQANAGAAISMDLDSNPAITGVTMSQNGINGLALDTGTLAVNTEWNDPDIVYYLNSDVTVPAGVTLTVGAGQIVKRPFFADIIVNGTMNALGTVSAPIIFTESRDDTAGGDTNNDVASSSPYQGNSGVILFTNPNGSSNWDYVDLRYGGYSNFSQLVVDSATLNISNSAIRNSSAFGLLAQNKAHVNLVNSLLVNNADTALRAETRSTVTAVNNTIDGNYRGVVSDGVGTTVTVTNSLIANQVRGGVSVASRGIVNVAYSDVFNPGTADGNYLGLDNQTGIKGNLSVDAKYVNRAASDWHLQSTSPVIDAATSTGAPVDDRDFNFRVDTPAVTNTGAGASPFFDMGAYEFGGRPRAVKHSPIGDVTDFVSQVRFSFRMAMDTSTFSPGSDVISFTGPNGPITVTGFQWISKYQLLVSFAQQVKVGDYQLVIGSSILDTNGNSLDTDGDGTRGEPTEDRYSATWKIVPPKIIARSTGDYAPQPLDHIDFTFDRAMDPQSFSLSDVLSFTGPNGDISVDNYTWVDSRTLRLSFATQTTLGVYEIALSPNISDIGGNLLDQSNNGIGGEDPADRYDAIFTLANIFHVSGNITQNTTWSGLTIVDSNVTVAAGVTLTIAPGTIVKMQDLASIVVQSGGTLLSNGTLSQPVTITSIHDDTIGGDTDQNGDKQAPLPGDWISIQIDSGNAQFEATHFKYGGGSTTGTWNQSGMLRTTGTATLGVSRSILQDAFFDGILTQGGTTTITNSVIAGADRGIVSWLSNAHVQVLNSTIVDNRIGLLGHGGTLNLVNSIVANNLLYGIDNDISPAPTISYTDFFNPGATNTHGVTNPIGINNNRAVDPQFVSPETGNYRLDFGSPLIDGANGSLAPATDAAGSPRYDDPRTANTGTLTGNNAFADLGAFEFVEGAPSDLDLIVNTVGGVAAAIEGDTVTVNWTVKNVGTAVAAGAWHDAVYLSTDAVWSPNDVLLGDALFTGSVGPNQSYANSADVKIPGVLPGNYYFIVRSNSDNALFEGSNLTNNAAASSTTAALDVPALGLGVPVTGELAESGDSIVYKLVVPAGSNIRISLDGAAGAVNELYVKAGELPTRQSFDTRGIALNQPDQSTAISGDAGGTCYILVYGTSLPALETFTLTATTAVFSIDSVFPATASNTGSVTVSIQGTDFDINSQPRLVDSANQVILPSQIYFGNSGLITATFDLTGHAAGAADVQVVNTGNITTTKTDALNVIAGEQGKLATSISAPERVRVGRDFVAYITYSNVGDTDLIAPIFRIVSNGRTSLSLTEDREDTSSIIELIGVNPIGPAGILQPGMTGRIAIYCHSLSSGTDSLKVETVQFPSTPIDYAAVESSMRATDLSDAEWTALFNQLKLQIGNTWTGYVAALSRDATLMTPAFGLNYSVADAFQLEVERAREALGTSVSGKLFLRDNGHPLSDATIVLVNDATGETFSTTSLSNGSYQFPAVNAGTYTVKVDGYQPTTVQSVTVGSADVTNVNLIVVPGSSISGAVLTTLGAPLPDVVVSAFGADNSVFVATTASDGTYSISLPPGTYTVQAGEGQYVQQSVSDIVVAAEQQVLHTNFGLNTAAKIAGKVSGPGGPIAGATVTVYGANGVSVGSGAVTSATGDYLISGIPPGQYTVQATADGFAPTRLSNVTFTAGTQLSNQNFTLGVGGSASGSVTLTGGDPVVAAIVIASAGGIDIAATNTDDDGTFTIADLAPGSYTFTISLPGFNDKTVNGTVTANGNVNLGAINLQTSGSVGGTVTRGASQTPLGGVRVVAWSGPDAVGEAVTDSAGAFEINYLAYGTYRITVGAEGQSIVTSTAATLSSGSPSAALDINVAIAGSIAGTLFESDGVTPVADASVTLYSGATALTTGFTDDAGRYEFFVTTTGTYSVQAAVEGKAFVPRTNLVIASGTELENINLTAGTAVVQGIIRDAATGQPATGGFVHVTGPGIIGIRVVTADSSGMYQFTGPNGAQLQIVAYAGTLAYSMANVTLASGTPATRDFSLTAGSSLTGVVTDAVSGNPVSGATIYAHNPAGPDGGFVTYTDESGAYSIIGLQAGTYDITGLEGDHQTIQSNGNAVSGSATTKNISLPAHTISVSGIVQDGGGRPLPGTVVRATDAQGNTVDFADTGADGSYSLIHLSAGTFTLTARANGAAEVSLPAVTVSAGNQVTGKNFAVNPIAFQADLNVADAAPFASYMSLQSFAEASDERSFTDRLFHRVPPTRLPDEVRLPTLETGETCVSVIVAYREVQGRIHARDTLFDAWREQYEAGKDIKSANAQLIFVQGWKALGTLAKTYVTFQKVAFEITRAGRLALGPGQVFLRDFLMPRVSQINSLLVTGKKLMEKSMKAIGSGQPSLPDAGTLLDTVKFTRQLVTDLAKALVDKNNLKLFGALSDRLGFVTDVISSVKEVVETISLISEAMNDKDVINGKVDFAKTMYIRASADATLALERYNWDVNNCDKKHDPTVKTPDEVPLPGWMGGPTNGGSSTNVNGVSSFDPNDKIGPAGYDNPATSGINEGYIQSGVMPYEIEFENSASFGATAPAQTVVITDTLDVDLDLSTVEFTGFGFGSRTFTVPEGLSNYQTTIDLRSEGTSLLVPVTLEFNSQTRVLKATFESLDPLTNLPPDDPDAGFLPVNNASHIGEGFITYTVSPKAGLSSGATIDNQASIVFDVNAPILTPTTHNTFDVGGPTSSVTALSVTTSSPITVNWSGSDDSGGSGIATYDIYVSDNNGDYTLWQAATSATSGQYTGQPGHTYRFYSVATDHVGHIEASPETADALTEVPLNSSPVMADKTFTIAENTAVNTAVGNMDATDADIDDTLTYSIIGGNASGAFAINATTGAIRVANASLLDFETTPSFSLTVQVSDNHGATDTATATINLTDVDESLHLTLGGSDVTWKAKQPPVVVLPQITVTGGVNLNGGSLILTIDAVGSAKKLLDLIHLASFSNLGTSTGTHLINGQLTLQINLGANATTAGIQTFLRGLTFATKGKGLKVPTRDVNVTLSAGNQITSVTQTIQVRKK